MTVQDTDTEVGLPNSEFPVNVSKGNVESYGTVNSESTESNIPPADRGKAAWLFLVGCFFLEGFVWGLPYSFGVFEKYYSYHEIFSSEPGIAAIGTVGIGIAYFIAPLVILILQRWPLYRRHVSILGLFTIATSLVAASFATCVAHLIVTQGLLYGIGGALLYNPFIFYLDEWFIKRKGLAFGVFWAGAGTFGVFVPLLLEWSLNKYGFEITLRAYASVAVSVLGVLIYFLRPRLPLPSKGAHRSLQLGFLKSPLFWVFQIGNIIQGLGNFMPQIYMPSYAYIAGFSPLAATLSVSLFNIACTLGPVFIGALIDQFHISTVLAISAVGSAASVFLLWGFAVNEAILYIFALVWGIFAGGYAATWTGCGTEIRRSAPGAELAVVISFMAAGRGLGAMISGPISEQLLELDMWKGKFDNAYGSKFGILIVFTGLTAIVSSFGFVTRFGRWNRTRTEEQARCGETEPLIP